MYHTFIVFSYSFFCQKPLLFLSIIIRYIARIIPFSLVLSRALEISSMHEISQSHCIDVTECHHISYLCTPESCYFTIRERSIPHLEIRYVARCHLVDIKFPSYRNISTNVYSLVIIKQNPLLESGSYTKEGEQLDVG